MANLDSPKGLVPVNTPSGGIRTGLYTITAGSTKHHIGDPMTLAAAGTVGTGIAGTVCVGVAMAFFDADGVPVSHYPAGSAAGYTCLIANDPNQEFMAQEDGAASDLALADIGLNIDTVGTHAGNDDTGISGCELDSSSVADTVTLQLRLLRKMDIPNNDLGDHCKWIVKINNHQLSAGVLGVAL